MLPANSSVSGRLADTLTSLFGRVISPADEGARLHKVGVLVVDGLGADLVKKFSGHARFLRSQLENHGHLAHSGMPSTTASALTSITTGVESGQHGLLGYQVRDPHTLQMVNHLKPFPDGVDPLAWQPVPTVFERAAQSSIPSIAVGESRFSGTDFSQAMLRGANYQPSSQLEDHLGHLKEFFDSTNEGVAYLYWPALDRIGHGLGVEHGNWVDALENLDAFASLLHRSLGPGEAIVLTADHGMVDVESHNQVWMESNHPLRHAISDWGGEPRLVQMYLHDDVDVTAFVIELQQFLGAMATAVSRDDAIDRGLFGIVPEHHQGRLGDVIVFAEDNYALYDQLTASEASSKMVGQHGSWTATETTVPVIALGNTLSKN